jgi:hypothetical protein
MSKQQTTTSKQSVANAEALLQRFTRERDELTERKAALADKRRNVAYDAHTGDGSAAKVLDGVHREAVELEGRIAGLDDAITEAKHRLDIAKQYEAKAFDREKAKRLRQQLAQFVAAAETLDNCLDLMVTTGDAMRAIVTELNRLGLSHPSHAQLDSLGGIALRSSLMLTPWSRHFERVSIVEKKSFSGLVQAWSPMVERQIAALEQTNETEAA